MSPSRSARRPAPGRSGRLGDHEPAGGRQASGRAGVDVRRDDRGGPERRRRAAAARACRARASRSSRRSRSARTRTRPVVGPVAGRWPCRNVSRSRKADGSQEASSILRTSSRPAGRSAPGRDDEERRARRRGPPAIRSAPALVARARRQEPRDRRSASSGRPDRCAPTAAAATHRAEVADRVAPALVELAGLDDDVGERARRRSAADGDDRGPCARAPRAARAPRSSRASRPRARRRSRDRVVGRIERQLERLRARDRSGRADRPPTAASRRISAAASAACSDVPQPVTTTGSPARSGRADGAGKAAAALSGPARSGRGSVRPSAGSAAIMSVMWYGGPRRASSACRSTPTGRAGPGSGAVGIERLGRHGSSSAEA